MEKNELEEELYNRMEKNRRRELLWEKIRNDSNTEKIAKYFEQLFETSEYEDETEFSDNYLINLVKTKDLLGNQDFTKKILDFYQNYLEGEKDITEIQYHRYKQFYNLNVKEEFLLSSYLEILPYERYLVVMNYFKEIVEKSALASSTNQVEWIIDTPAGVSIKHNEWIDDYPKRDIDFYMINESKYILWENKSDLLDSEYEELKDELFPYG
tara:strand:- start:1028 stop:1663 length:636 start_codon:yes stop_codon:yes gene_type:complete